MITKLFTLICTVSMLYILRNRRNIVITGFFICLLISMRGMGQNYVRSNEPSRAIKDTATVNAAASIQDVKRSTQYFDGHGRLIQTVVRQATPAGKDLVSPVVYDEFEREVNKYLVYPAADNTGGYKSTAVTDQATFMNNQFPGENSYYSKTVFENSPLNRPLKSMAPGANWAGSNRGVANEYSINTTSDSVRIWNIPASGNVPVSPGTYGNGQLYKSVSTNEQGSRSVVYTDLNNRPVLKKEELIPGAADGHFGWLCTYYVYDDLGNVFCVIPPKAVNLVTGTWVLNNAILDGLCFSYRYDEKNRVVVKNLPGADSMEIVYDVRGRLAFTRDGNLRPKGQWVANFYDGMDRVVMTGLYTKNGLTRESLQSAMNNVINTTKQLSYDIPVTRYLLIAFHDGRSLYEAADSIIFDDGFDAGSSAAFETSLNANGIQGTTVVAANNTYSAINMADIYPLSYTYYDDYTFPGQQPKQLSSFLKLQAGDNPNPENISDVSAMTYGARTGSRVRVLDTEQWLTTTVYYDDKGRPVQLISDNLSGGKDITTNLYDFNSRLLSSYLQHTNIRAGATPSTKLLTIYNYNAVGSIVNVKKILNDESTAKTILTNSYNELGELITKVKGNNLHTENYEYNIRGWSLGMNRNYVKTSTGAYFGYELGYDKITPFSDPTAFVNAQFNGNIAGYIWRGTGDKRKYNYAYDNTGRILRADFLNNNGSAWSNATVDFSVKIGDGTNVNTAYDANGNIIGMMQKGLKAAASAVIDDLKYRYKDSSNQLLFVRDAANDANSTLGDFKESAQNNTANQSLSTADYGYDANGNLIVDKNKNIDSIRYNHLSLPKSIYITGKGNIQYLYDAAGNKLRKTVVDNTTSPAKTTVTDYISGFEYKDDSLQFLAHEEGRIRAVYKTGQPVAYTYDYFVRDHLGNVRMVLTEQSDLTMYAATMETAAAPAENSLFSNIDNSRVATPFGYPSDDQTAKNESVAKLTARDGGKKVGPSIVLRVMAGDTVQIATRAFYKSATPQQRNNAGDVAENIVAELAQVFNGGGGGSGTHGTSIADEQNTPFNSNFYNNDYQHLKEKDPDQQREDKPKAYLNFVLFDDQFNLVDENSGVKQVKGEPDQLQTLSQDQMTVAKSGFLYVYTSNESPQDVYFDNLVVTQATGPILEETHYYPFGLTMAGISSNALKGANYPENRKKYNGIEYTSELDLDIYDAQLRNLDPQIGRWNQIDPKIENMEAWSPYASNYDNPIRYNDFLGDEPGGPGDPIKQVGLVTGREYTLTAPTGVGSAFMFGGQYLAGTINEIVAGINQNLNPLYSAGNGMQALFTAKDLQTGGPMSTGDAIFSIATSIPMSKLAGMFGKLSGTVEGMVIRSAEKTTTEGAMNIAAKELEGGEDLIRVRHHTDLKGLRAIKNTQSIQASRAKPYGVDVELPPFVRASTAEFGQNGTGAYIDFSVPASRLGPIPGGYMGAERGKVARIVTDGAFLNIKNLNPTFRRWKLW